jgi:hypothetical protein
VEYLPRLNASKRTSPSIFFERRENNWELLKELFADVIINDPVENI